MRTERGVLTFADERRIFRVRSLADTGSCDVTIAVTGTPGDTETTLTSSPSLPEPDIMALLVTGRTLDQMRGEEYEVARARCSPTLQAGSGPLSVVGCSRQPGSAKSGRADAHRRRSGPKRATHRRQELTDELKLVYSTNLTDSNDQIWVAEYDVTRRFQTRAVRQEDNSYRMDFRHDIRFGGQPEPRRSARPQPDIAEVTVNVPAGIDEARSVKTFGG